MNIINEIDAIIKKQSEIISSMNKLSDDLEFIYKYLSSGGGQLDVVDDFYRSVEEIKTKRDETEPIVLISSVVLADSAQRDDELVSNSNEQPETKQPEMTSNIDLAKQDAKQSGANGLKATEVIDFIKKIDGTKKSDKEIVSDLKESVEIDQKIVSKLVDKIDVEKMVEPKQVAEPKQVVINKNKEELTDKQTSGLMPSISNDKNWPLAVTESNLIKNERSKWVRANLISSSMGDIQEPILDFGCGDGHLTMIIKNKEKTVYGYDHVYRPSWEKFFDEPEIELKSTFINDLDELSDIKFGSIIMYDVIDHIERDSVTDVLDKVHSMLKDDGRLYISAHPFSSINGGHIYEEHNKAYLHMLLPDDELEKCAGYVPNIKVVRPNAQYQKFFAGRFNIEDKELVVNELDKWVVDNILDPIYVRWYRNASREQVKKILEINRINYVLSKIK